MDCSGITNNFDCFDQSGQRATPDMLSHEITYLTAFSVLLHSPLGCARFRDLEVNPEKLFLQIRTVDEFAGCLAPKLVRPGPLGSRPTLPVGIEGSSSPFQEESYAVDALPL